MGKNVPVRAQITSVDALNRHGDWQNILPWLGGLQHPPKKTYIVHGETRASLALQDHSRERLGRETIIPKQGDFRLIK